MDTNILFIDFETVDPHLKKLGPGWVHGEMRVLGYGYRLNSGSTEWSTCPTLLRSLANSVCTIVAHNTSYDLGILFDTYGIKDIVERKDLTLIDTILLAKLYDNSLLKYGLDDLAKLYLGMAKNQEIMAEIVFKHGLYKDSSGANKSLKWLPTNIKKFKKYAYEHMDEVFALAPETVIEYCKNDIDCTAKLYEVLIDRLKEPTSLGQEHLTKWIYRLSCVIKQLLIARQKGVRFDVEAACKASIALGARERDLYKELTSQLCPNEFVEFNPNSSTQLRLAADSLKIPYSLSSKTKNAKLDKAWLHQQIAHPFCKTLKEYRRIQKIRRDFLDKLLNMQKLLPEHKRGYVYPQFNIFGAETGRFSSQYPNLQQIPSRDKELSPLLRKCFLPLNEDELWVSGDYRQQEFRIFAHLCHTTGIDSSLKQSYDHEPLVDYHNLVSGMIGIDRDPAKTINLGGLYGMGRKKQTLSLIALGIDEEKARSIYTLYHEMFPQVKQLTERCANALKTRKFVYTLYRRQSRAERPYLDPETGDLFTFDYQGISKVIQGSAADQIIEVCVKCYEQDINPMFGVHDALEFSIKKDKIKLDLPKIRSIMENTCLDTISIPMLVKFEVGPTWGEVIETDIN